jgi:hypothetical protein
MSVVFGKRFDPREFDEHAPPPGLQLNPDTNESTCVPSNRIGIVWLFVNFGNGDEYQAHEIAGELNCQAGYGSAALSKIIHRLERLASEGLLSIRDVDGPKRARFYRLTELGESRQAGYDLLR